MRRLLVTVGLLCGLAFPEESMAKTFVIPHILEATGRISDTQFTFDTTLFVIYSGGLPGAGSKVGEGGATIDLYLYGNNGPLQSATGHDVCDPCSFTLSSSNRKQSISIDDLIVAAGGFPSPVVTAFGVIVVTGDARNLVLQGFVSNSHSSAFDLSVFGFAPVEIQAAAK